MRTPVHTAKKCSPLSTKIHKDPCTFSVFEKLWPFVSAVVSAHVRDLSRADFIINTAYLLRSSGLSPTSAIFQTFTLLNSATVPVYIRKQAGVAFDRNLSASFIEFRLVSEQSLSTPAQFVLNILSKHLIRAWFLRESDN